MKHIESIQPEYAADDMTALLLSDATASAALSRLLLDWTGCAIPPTADTPESEVEELVPLCLSILRRHWTTPLTAIGDGTTPMSLADLMRRLILGRVDGNESLGIPPANANIPTAVSALRRRKIDCAYVPEGISLINLICNKADSVTELDDNNTYDVLMKNPCNIFTGLKSLTVNCETTEHTKTFDEAMHIGSMSTHIECPLLKEVHVPVYGYGSLESFILCNNDVITFPSLEKITCDNRYYVVTFISDLPCKEINMPNLLYMQHSRAYRGTISRCANLRAVRMDKLIKLGNAYSNDDDKQLFIDCPCLIEIRIGFGFESNFDIKDYNPTMALRTDTTAEDYVDLREDMSFANNLEQFLSNFKTYIAQRLTDKGSGLTLYLSQAVRDAIQQDPEIVSIITSKGWTISPAPSV
jgi:hypothetical protein